MSERLATYERLQHIEPELQAGRGMVRNGELQLIARVCKEHEVAAYVEFGCGPCYALAEVRNVCGPAIQLFGFEHRSHA